ncbi:transketolase [Lachnoclostridium edouardi]|uniref:transketolase n=1 Tax=Lachnoclostridium edouardi TaxID=1926283 RepID=UPI000C7B1F16|nr:transketolase [Lachnoclostridium edouardi]
MTDERAKELQRLCHGFRNEIVDLLHSIQTGHPGGSLSCTEIVTTLYFDKMNVDPKDPNKEGRDHFILSKGHAAPILYIVLAEMGYFPKEELKTLRQINSNLQGHPCVHKTPGVELSTGPLGLGLGAGLGMALSERLKGSDSYTYVVMGDGEIQEGAIWEAAMAASKFKADHLIGILDNNGVQLDGTLEEIMPMGDLKAKWESFGWEVIPCDGHDVQSISDAVDAAKKVTGKPILILAKTVKGKGVSFMEGKNTWHGKAISDEDYKNAKEELGGAF